MLLALIPSTFSILEFPGDLLITAHDLLCTKGLASILGCPFEFITSIGWAVRDGYVFPDDLDSYGAAKSERKFKYFQRRYPTLNGLMDDVYELLPGYYGGRTYFVRKSMAYQSHIVAGERMVRDWQFCWVHESAYLPGHQCRHGHCVSGC